MRHRVLVYVQAVDVATEGAVWYARRIGHGRFEAVHVPRAGTDTGIYARWFDFTGGEPRLEVRRPGTDPVAAVLDATARLRAQPDDVVTVVVPEQFSKPSLLAAAQREQFRLKLRLLVEPNVVVSDVPAVTSERRPEGKTPGKLAVRVLVGRVETASRRAVEYARLLGADDLRIVHFGDRTWAEDELGVPVDDAPRAGRLGDALLAYVRRLTADPNVACNVVLPERIRPGLAALRSRRALAIKRCLLFEPHVILSSVPYRDT